MAIETGTHFGPYRVLGLLGKGGMGEVFQALDERLDRAVALKVLARSLSEGSDRLKRFEREARLVAQINHPAVVQIFDVGFQDGMPYLVMELLKGENLRQRMNRSRLSLKEALGLGAVLAQGLAAAHEKAILHRDLKPENVFLTEEGGVKLLDFGLACLQESESRDASSEGFLTEPEMLLGTVPYLSPEQIAHDKLDARSDLFSLGILLWEMLTGSRPFTGPSTLDILYAISRQELPEETPSELPPALGLLLRRCLEKKPAKRFQSAQDLAFALENLAGMPSGHLIPTRVPTIALPEASNPQLKSVESPLDQSSEKPFEFFVSFIKRPWKGWLWIVGLIALAGVLGLPWLRPRSFHPNFEKLPHFPASVESAFFGEDGRTVYFSARLQGEQPGIFVLGPSDPEPRSLGIQDAVLLGVSSHRELVVAREYRRWYGALARGRMALMPAAGGNFRDLQENVSSVALAPERQEMALITLDDQFISRLEYPQGKIVHTSTGGGGLKLIKFLGKDQGLAFVEADGAKTSIVLLQKGRRSFLWTQRDDLNGDSLTGLAWHSRAGEIWFSKVQSDQTDLWALSLKGKLRWLWRGEGRKQLLDISREGRLLLVAHQQRQGVWLQKAGEARTKDLSLLDGTQVWGLTTDGQSVLLLETPTLEGGTLQDMSYVRPTDGRPAVRLVRGTCYALSPDNRHVQIFLNDLTPQNLDGSFRKAFEEAGLDPGAVFKDHSPHPFLLFASLDLGKPWVLPLPETFANLGPAYVLPDQETVLFACEEKGKASRIYKVSRRGGIPQSLSPEGYRWNVPGFYPISSDGRQVMLFDGQQWFRMPVEGGHPIPIKGLLPQERPLRFGKDGDSILLVNKTFELPIEVHQLSLKSGRRETLYRSQALDLTGIQHISSVWTTPQASLFAIGFEKRLSQLYQVEGAP